MNILDRRFKWVPSTQTDVQATWRRFGWRPVSELPQPKVAQIKQVKKEKAS